MANPSLNRLQRNRYRCLYFVALISLAAGMSSHVHFPFCRCLFLL